MSDIAQYKRILTVERIYNFIIGTGFSVNLLTYIKLIQWNEVLTIITGISAAVLAIVQIINKVEAYKTKKLQNKDLELHLKKEELELSKMREEKRQRRFKYKKNVSKTNK